MAKRTKAVESHQTTATPGASRGARDRFRRHLPVAMMLLVLLTVSVVTMPKFYAGGDNFTARAEAIHFLNTAQLGIPYGMRGQLAGQTQNRGQFFYENDKAQRLCPKYGIGYTIMYAIGVLPERVLRGALPLFCGSRSLLVWLNIQNLVLSLVTFAYLYALAALYTRRELLRIGFVIASVFATFLRFYLRIPAFEVFQVAMFVPAIYHALVFIRRSAEGNERRWAHLAAAAALVGFLTLAKTSFVVLFGPLWLFALLAGPREGNLFSRVWRNGLRLWPRYLVALVLPTVIFLGLLMWANTYRFGDPLNTGYGQWAPGTAPLWSHTYFGRRFMTYFVRPNRFNIFIHYPLFLIAIPGVWSFAVKYRAEAAFLGLACLFYFMPLSMISSVGSWCYGPRYMLPFLIIGSLPAISFWERLGGLRATPKWWLAGGAKICIVGILLWSAAMQFNMNRLNWLTFYSLRGPLNQVIKQLEKHPQVDRTAWEAADTQVKAYLKPFHEGNMMGDLIAFREKGKPFPLVGPIVNTLPASARSEREGLRRQLEAFLKQIAAPNYMFLE